MAMRVPATDYEMGRPSPGVTDKEFDARKDLWEGVNGRDRIDTRFENTQRQQVLAPRGDARGRPMPRDALFAQADNHAEWGPDVFREKLEYGMDGPDSDMAYHGAGLPRRADISYPANRGAGYGPHASQGMPSSTLAVPSVNDEWGMEPMGEAIDGDI